jgi:hypothetical protein
MRPLRTMSYLVCIIAFMATHTPFHYTVSIGGEQVLPAIRQATFKEVKKNYSLE